MFVLALIKTNRYEDSGFFFFFKQYEVSSKEAHVINYFLALDIVELLSP